MNADKERYFVVGCWLFVVLTTEDTEETERFFTTDFRLLPVLESANNKTSSKMT